MKQSYLLYEHQDIIFLFEHILLILFFISSFLIQIEGL